MGRGMSFPRPQPLTRELSDYEKEKPDLDVLLVLELGGSLTTVEKGE
jgi:hypothetical protein